MSVACNSHLTNKPKADGVLIAHSSRMSNMSKKQVSVVRIACGNRRIFGRHILGDRGEVILVRRKGATKGFKHGRKSPRVPTLTRQFLNGQANPGS